MEGNGWHRARELQETNNRQAEMIRALTERVSVVSRLAIRAVAEGWTLPQLEKELWK